MGNSGLPRNKMRISSKLSDDFLRQPYDATAGVLSRFDLARRLTRLYASLEHGTVAILHGRWGTGKTTFAKKWLAGLQAEDLSGIYFNAFKHDYLDDPFLALNAAILRQFEQSLGADDAEFRKFKDRAVAASKKLLVAGAKVGVKVATLGALSAADLDISDEISGSVSDASSDLAEKATQAILDEHAKAEATFDSFRASLQRIIQASANSDDRDSGRLIFVVDELDRCRPDFALRLIEILKHFFDVEGLHFVLIANKEFLKKSVAAKYGLADDSGEYLDKFFDFSIFFEEQDAFRNQSPAVVYSRHVVSELLGNQSHEAREIEEAISEISGAFNLTFRQIDRIATNAALAHASFAENEYRPSYLVSYMCFFKAIYPDLFARIKHRRFDFSDIREVLEKGDWEEYSNIGRVLDILEYHTSRELDEDDPKFRGFNSGFYRFNFRNRLDVLPYLANNVVDRFAR